MRKSLMEAGTSRSRPPAVHVNARRYRTATSMTSQFDNAALDVTATATKFRRMTTIITPIRKHPPSPIKPSPAKISTLATSVGEITFAPGVAEAYGTESAGVVVMGWFPVVKKAARRGVFSDKS